MNALIVENQVMIRELLVQSCARMMPYDTIYSAGSGAAAVMICRAHAPELVILDLVLPDRDFLDLIGEILKTNPAGKIIAVFGRIDELTVHRIPPGCVRAIIDRTEPLSVLHEAIASVAQGNRFVSAAIQRLYASSRADPTAFSNVLSDREQEVLGLVGEGLTNGQIAERLEISLCTAKHHRANVMSKLDIHSTAKLIHYAIEKGFTRVPEGAGCLR